MTISTSASGSRPDRAPARVRLDPATIIAAGFDLAAIPGTTTISVRDLGARLGADPTAVYRHFRNKEHLMQALLDDLIQRSVSAVTADPDDWAERVRQLAMSTLTQFSRYPAIGVEAVVLTTHGPGELDAIELMLDAFSRAGLEGDDLVRHYAMAASHMLSGAAGIARARAERGDAGDGVSPWLDGPLQADPRRYPLIASVSTQLTNLDDLAMYRLGIDTIIESARRYARG